MVRFLAAVMTRYILAVACCVTLTAGDLTQLRQLEEKHRMFELRDLLDAPGENAAETLVYRAITNSRFGREREAVSQFRAFLATNPAPEMERKARYELSNALTRLGEIGEAASELAAALRLTPEAEAGRADSENARAFLASLSGVAAQTVEFGPPAPIQARRNELGLWVVPVDINSQRSEWILDTGASLSTVTESEARRMGLAIREVHGYARGYTQAKNPARLAVAGEVGLGYARLRNVVFLVLADEALRISPLKYPIHGILGLPALRALGCVDLSAKGELTLDCGAKPPQGRPNFFFDGLAPIVQVLHLGHSLQMALDTGSRATVLYPSVRDALAQWERYQLTSPGAAGFAGGGGSVQVQASTVPSIQLEIQGRTLYLQGIKLLSQALGGAGVRDGILGIDAFAGGFRLDFRAMQFSPK
jgi:predicted aspartyl protease